MTSNPTIVSCWPWKTKDHPRFSLVAGTKSNHQLENRRILLANTRSRHEEDLSFDRTTMEKQTRSEGIKRNFYKRNKRTRSTTMEKGKGNEGIKKNFCGRDERLTTSFKTTKERNE